MGRKLALLVGNGIYSDKRYPSLMKAEADVKALADVLRASDIGAFDSIQALINEPAKTISQAIELFFLKEKKQDDLLLLYFTGHGEKDQRDRWHFICKDTNYESLYSTAISAELIKTIMDTCRSIRQIIILDTCYSGAFFEGAKGVTGARLHTTEQLVGRGRVVLAAAGATERAWEGDRPISIFTNYLVQGLKTGEADRNKKGSITIDDWFDYAFEQVREETNTQSPTKWVSKQQGSIIIAKNPFLIEQPQQKEQLRLDDGQQVRQELVATPRSSVLSSDISSAFDLLYSREEEVWLDNQQEQKRRQLIKELRNIWIDGLLEQSARKETRISLHLQERQDLSAPWHSRAQELPQPPRSGRGRPLRTSTSILEMYDHAGGSLLILGEQGAGKTVLLLELARALLNRAEPDPTHPLPVIFRLSSWAQGHLPFVEWLEKEMQWMLPDFFQFFQFDQILPLLDGLDEVASEVRANCVEAIRDYHQERLNKELVPLVICCRSDEYKALPTRIMLNLAVSILPLTDDKIRHYLQHARGLQSLQQVLHTDYYSELTRLACQPLMLSIFTWAYQAKGPADLPRDQVYTYGEKPQHKALVAFVERLTRQRGWRVGTKEQVEQWLVCLAKQVHSRQETVFSAINLQPKWLQNKATRFLYDSLDKLVIRFTYLTPKLRIGRKARNWLLIGLIIALCSGLLNLLGWLLVLLGSHVLSSIGNWMWVIIVVLHLLALKYPFWLLLSYPWRTSCLPWDLDRFLDDAVEHHLLYKVGTRYIFIHRLLLDYLASLEMPPSTKRDGLDLVSKDVSSVYDRSRF